MTGFSLKLLLKHKSLIPVPRDIISLKPRSLRQRHSFTYRNKSIMTAETQPLINTLKGINIPKAAPWAFAVPSQRNASRYLPQTIAHRGYKAAWPENSMAAFKAAVNVGAHAIETDVHLSKDGVVVLSHDPSLKRCFGVDRKISECDWEFLSTLTTMNEPHEKLPRLSDLLEYLVSGPETEKIWVLLDIKIDDAPDELLAAMAKTFTQVPSKTPWDQRIVLGCWNATFIKASLSLLPGFPLAHISFSTMYSHHFLPIPNLGFNVFQRYFVGPLGSFFLHSVKKASRPVYAWTVNEVNWMEWCIRRNIPKLISSADVSPAAAKNAAVIDGVITDDPKLFIEVCQRVEDELDGKTSGALSPRRFGTISSFGRRLAILWDLLSFNLLGTGVYLYRRYQGHLDHLDAAFLKMLRTQST